MEVVRSSRDPPALYDGSSCGDLRFRRSRGRKGCRKRFYRRAHFVNGFKFRRIKRGDSRAPPASFDQEPLLLELARGSHHGLAGNLQRSRQTVLGDVFFWTQCTFADRVEDAFVDPLDQSLGAIKRLQRHVRGLPRPVGFLELLRVPNSKPRNNKTSQLRSTASPRPYA